MAERVNILGVAVDAVTMPEAVAAVEYYMDARAGVTVATANAEMIMRATKDAALRDVLAAAALVVPDGAGTVWAARHLGHAMPERVAGYDLVQELLRRAPAAHRRIYFFGAAPGVAEKAKAKAEQLYPGIKIVGVRDGLLFQYFILIYNPSIISNTGIICNKECIALSTEDIPYFFCVIPKTQLIDIKHGNSIKVNTTKIYSIIAIIKVIT